jgi:hypothetical protein
MLTLKDFEFTREQGAEPFESHVLIGVRVKLMAYRTIDKAHLSTTVIPTEMVRGHYKTCLAQVWDRVYQEVLLDLVTLHKRLIDSGREAPPELVAAIERLQTPTP